MFPPRIPTSSVVKNTVAASLKGRRAPALLASLCCVFACLICSLINSVLSIAFVGSFSFVPYIFGAVLSFFVLMPLFLGTVRYFWRFTDGAEDSPSEVFFYFSCFSLYKRAISCVFAVGLRCAVVVILCLLPYMVRSLRTFVCFCLIFVREYIMLICCWGSGFWHRLRSIRIFGHPEPE